MPGRDQTGPLGEGPMTGGGWGPCAGVGGRPVGGGPRFGRALSAVGTGVAGRGRGFRNRFNATGIPFSAQQASPTQPVAGREQDVAGLQEEVTHLRSMLSEVEQRLKRLEKE